MQLHHPGGTDISIYTSTHLWMNTRQLLIDLTVRDFVAAVASADEPVPAGGSVAALTGASSAALLALVCDVLERHTPGVLIQERERARALHQELLDLVDAGVEPERPAPPSAAAGSGPLAGKSVVVTGTLVDFDRQSAEAAEGLGAFLEKRPPRWAPAKVKG